MTGTGVGGMRDLDYKSALSVIHVDASIVSDDRWALNPHPGYLLYNRYRVARRTQRHGPNVDLINMQNTVDISTRLKRSILTVSIYGWVFNSLYNTLYAVNQNWAYINKVQDNTAFVRSHSYLLGKSYHVTATHINVKTIKVRHK